MKEKMFLSTKQALIISITIQFCVLQCASIIWDGGLRVRYTQFSFVCYWLTILFLFVYNYRKKYDIVHRIYIANAFVAIYMAGKFLDFYIYEYGKEDVIVASIACLSIAIFVFIAKQVKSEIKLHSENNKSLDKSS